MEKIRTKGRSIGWALGTTGLLAAVSLMMVLAPAGGASVIHNMTKLSAPYKHARSISTSYISTSGTCKAKVKNPLSTWVKASGGHLALLSSSASGCINAPVGPGYADAYATSDFSVYIPIHLKSGGHNFTVNTSYDMTLVANLVGNWVCPLAKNIPGSYTSHYCSESADAYTSWGFELFDATNGSYLSGEHTYVNGPENYTDGYNDSYCYSGSCYSYNYTYGCVSSASYFANCVPSGTHVTGSNTSWLNTHRNCEYSYAGACYFWNNWTLNGSHNFWIDVYFDSSISSYISNWGPFHSATALINAATVPNLGWKVTAITVR